MSGSPGIYAFRRNLVVAASAGTGKTHALVGVAVHLLLGACEAEGGGLRPAIAPDALIATTFSRKAAGEIRARLARELERLALGDPDAAYREDLDRAWVLATGGRLPDSEIALRARAALGRLSRARIGTLHSFAASLVREHALAAGLSPEFVVADEEIVRARAYGAIERVLEAGAADEVQELVRLAGGIDSLVELVRQLLERIGEDGRSCRDLALPAGDALELEREMSSLVDHARSLVGDARLGAEASRVLEAHAAGDTGRLEGAVGALCGVRASGKHSPSAQAFFELRSALPKLPSNAERGRHLVRRWRMRSEILPRAQILKEVLCRAEEEIARENARDGVLGFSAVLRAARDVLRDHPGIARDVGRTAEALLVDEFQDTSALQRDLVQLVWDRDPAARSRGTVTPLTGIRGHGLLIVGDRKQSIYAFRGADVAVFAELCVGLAGAPARRALGIPAGLAFEPESPIADFVALRHNRRGAAELLDFANAFSRCGLVPEVRPAELYEIDYAPETEDLLPPEGAAPPASPRTHWLRPAVSTEHRSTSLLREAEVIAARISCIVRGGELLVRGAPARFRDVAILAKRHSMLDVAAYTLAKAGIPHVVAGMGFYGAREVRDLAAMLACLVDSDDSLARAEVLRGPWAGVSDRTLVGLTDPHLGLTDVDRWSTGDRRRLIDDGDRAALVALGRVVTELRPVVDRIGAGPALREAVRALELEEALILMPRGEQRVANVRKLLALADGARDPRAFLARLSRAAAEEQKEGEAANFSDDDDAVRLLTVHASKGLAFPIVFLPEVGAAGRHGSPYPALVRPGTSGRPSVLVTRIVDATGTPHDTPSFAAAKVDLARREAAERRRLRYVATTRASEAMFFVGDRAPAKNAPPDTTGTLTSVVLAALAAAPASQKSAWLDVETGASLDRSLGPIGRTHPPVAPFAPVQPRRHPSRVTMSAERLIEAEHCTRLLQLVQRMGLPPQARRPVPEGELRRALVWAGAWGRKVLHEMPRLRFGERFVFTDASADPRIAILGSIDALVEWPDGACDVLLVAADPLVVSRYELYASAALHAAASRRPGQAIRVGLLTLTAPPMEEPYWMPALGVVATRVAVRQATLSSASSPGLPPRADVTVCQRIACAYRGACYPEPAKVAFVAGQRSQLEFEFATGRAELGAPRRRRRRR